VSVTFDNLGEAMDLAIGTWPQEAPVGEHYSVTEVLPKVLDLLDAQRVRCTYFLEGWSADVYPTALQALTEGGHEVAYHGWRHEHWRDIKSRDLEHDLIARGVASMREKGIELRGFRPPGGVLTPWTLEILREHGFTYVSPAGHQAGLLDGLVALPFRWTAIDAYYLFDAFAPLRRHLGDDDAPLSPDHMVTGFEQAMHDVIATGGALSLLFHPFLQSEPDHFEAMARIVEAVASSEDLWCAPCAEHAHWAFTHRERLPANPQLDERSWQ
jgi:peptidoglycan/xylan/chitin deacetylase (PgdA/CDA1 family)